MSRHQLQPTCAATAMCANVLRLASTASQVATLAAYSWLDRATLGLLYDTSTGSGTAPSCSIMFSLSSGGSSAFGTRSAMVSSLHVCLLGMKTPPGPRMLQPPPPRIDRQRAQARGRSQTNTGASTSPASTSGSTPERRRASTRSAPDLLLSLETSCNQLRE